MGLKDKILAADDLSTEMLDVPEWDVKLEIRTMNGAERGELMRQATMEDGKFDYVRFYPVVVVACTFDPETGDRVFELSDAEAINLKSSKILERIAIVAMRLSGLDEESRKRAEGNSTLTTMTSILNGASPTT